MLCGTSFASAGAGFRNKQACGGRELVERTPMELVMMLYDWATYVGYSSEDFDDFVEQCWE